MASPSPTTSIDRRGVTAAVIAACAWSATGIFVRQLPDLSPLSIVAGRFTIAMLAAAPLLRGPTRRQVVAAVRSTMAWTLALLMVGSYLLAVIAFQLTSIAEATLLLGTSPLFALAYKLIRGHPSPPTEQVGALLTMAGVTLIVAPGLTAGASLLSGRLLGNLLALTAGGLIAGYSLTYRMARLRDEAPSARSTTIFTFGVGALGMLAGTLLLDGPAALTAWAELPTIGPLVGLGVLSTVVPTTAYAIASSRIPSVVATSIRMLTPLMATVLAAVLLRELPSWWTLPGGLLIIAGLLVMTVIRRGSTPR